MMLMSTSTVKDAAIKFIDFYASEEILRKWGGDPVRGRTPASYVAYDNPAFKKYNPFLYDQFKAGTLFEGAIEAPNFRGLAEMYSILADAVHAVLLGNATPQQALDEAQKQCQDIRDRYTE
jgi:ABC-type glycerol-3-phosphate transport system substrate-binding protein